MPLPSRSLVCTKTAWSSPLPRSEAWAGTTAATAAAATAANTPNKRIGLFITASFAIYRIAHEAGGLVFRGHDEASCDRHKSGGGQGEPEAGRVVARVRADPATGSLDDFFYDREPDACSASRGVARFFDAIEALENIWQVTWRNPVTGVGDRNQDFGALRFATDRCPPARRRVARSILQQVAQHLSEAIGLGARDEAISYGELHGDAFRLERRTRDVEGRAHRLRQVDVLAYKLAIATIVVREGVKRARQPDQALRLLMQRAELFRRRRDHSIAHGFEISL